MQSHNIFWFRRDLRLDDNAGLYEALKAGIPVLPIFIFDEDILNKLDNKNDRRVSFIYDKLANMKNQLQQLGSDLRIYYGKPLDIFKKLSENSPVASVFTNHDYEPYARKRDAEIARFLQEKGIGFFSFKDQVIFEKDEVLKDDGKPYTVFTPYSRKWKLKLAQVGLPSFPVNFKQAIWQRCEAEPMIPMEEIGFKYTTYDVPASDISDNIISNYHNTRDYPGLMGTSRLSVHLRFGTISIRQLAEKALRLNEKYLNELIWRDFYQMILWHFPQVNKSFKPEYDFIAWINDETQFDAWCKGNTGYPIVDAGMRELLATGHMHNRVRMIVASFLTKHLLIDWRWGEAWFAEKLMDFELASNNGGWQWAAGSGCDAAPYFRVFNPALQTQKFDPELVYVKKWVPEFQEFSYPRPIVDHAFARNRCLDVYAAALKMKAS